MEPAPAGRVLVVEDHEVNRVLLARRLARQGYDVGQAADGRLALDELRRRPYDLVLLDVMMPVVDGYSALQAMKADPELRHVPVLMVSADDAMATVVRCIEAGAEDYLAKPYDPVLLRARVVTCLEKKRLRDQELGYLRDVGALAEAAAALERGDFDPAALAVAAARPDELGRLARVFASMAEEVRQRESRLRGELQRLRVRVDEARKEAQVAEITDSVYFQSLQEKARELRRRPRGG